MSPAIFSGPSIRLSCGSTSPATKLSKRSAMTISYDQVNQKMYRSSVARWRNYEKHLGPLIDALVDEVEEHEALVASQVKSD